MRILLAQTLSYLFSRGGAQKANRAYLESLVQRGHQCRVITPAAVREGEALTTEAFLEELNRRQLEASHVSTDLVIFNYRGVEIHAVTTVASRPGWPGQQLGAYLIQQIEESQPTWILIPDDYSYGLMEAALMTAPDRVIAMVYTPAVLPFGPLSWIRDTTKARLLQKTAGIITISHFIQEYIHQWQPALNVIVLPMPVFGRGPFPYLARFDEGFVTMLNPSAIKGISIFLELARQMPALAFAAVPSWATTGADRAALEQLPNVHLLKPADNLDEILAQTRLLLMPSLWAEGFTLTSVETMLRGIPVIASNAGGLPEAKLGVDYVLPVNPVEQFVESAGGWPPEPIVPAQDVTPWRETIEHLLSDQGSYRRVAEASQTASLAYIRHITVEPFELFLQNLTPALPAGHPARQHRAADSLSNQQRTLLALKLSRQRKTAVASQAAEAS